MNDFVVIAAVAVGALAVALAASDAAAFTPAWNQPDEALPDEPDQLPTVLETIELSLDPSTYMTGTLPGDLADANVRAFLNMLAVSEGTYGKGDNGYNVMFGDRIFTSYADHPRSLLSFTDKKGRTLQSSAAGRYQFLARTWDVLAAKLGLPDFSPACQDAACVELIRERGALADVRAGRFALAVTKCAPTWASLPGAGYDQPEQTLQFLTAAFTGAGGTITA